MYGEYLNFSSVSLPGAGGSLNSSNAISSDKLTEMNKAGKKWRTDREGNLSFHNEAIIRANEANRKNRESLVNRSRTENSEGPGVMQEIMGRKNARAAAFREIKRKEYNFADDTELLSMPQPFSQAKCKGLGKCNCETCTAQYKENQQFREWSSEQRKKLQSGEVKGEFAGPQMSFPISSEGDVSAAWSSVGRAANPRKIMSEIIRIANKFGWEDGLPQTVRDRIERGESGLPSPSFSEWPSTKGKKLSNAHSGLTD